METMTMSADNEVDGLQKLKKYLEEQIYAKQKKEVCLEFDGKPSAMYFKQIIDAFFDYKSCYLKMIKYVKEPSLTVQKVAVHAGEDLFIPTRKIIVGDVNEGGQIITDSNIVVIGEIRGNVTLLHENASVFATKYTRARICTKHGLVQEINGTNLLINAEDIGGKLWQE